MSTPLTTFEIENGIARLVLNRPKKRNALSRQLIAELQQAVDSVAQNDQARLLLIAAEGPVFCAGMDLSEMQQRATAPNAEQLWQEDTQAYRDLLVSLFTLPLPTLAVVQGPALAGGLGLVLACDLVLASTNAFFALPEPKRGITAAVVAPLLIHRVGPSWASYLLLSGKRVMAQQAHQMGLCHELSEADQLLEAEENLYTSILTGAPSALEKTKQTLWDCKGQEVVAQLDRAMQTSAEARQTDDAREGLAAFLEKREPAWVPPTDSTESE